MLVFSLILLQNGYYSPFYILGFRASAGQDRLNSLQLKGIFVVASRLRLLNLPFDPEVPCCSAFGLRCSECDCIHFAAFQLLFVHFHGIYILQEKYIKLT